MLKYKCDQSLEDECPLKRSKTVLITSKSSSLRGALNGIPWYTKGRPKQVGSFGIPKQSPSPSNTKTSAIRDSRSNPPHLLLPITSAPHKRSSSSQTTPLSLCVFPKRTFNSRNRRIAFSRSLNAAYVWSVAQPAFQRLALARTDRWNGLHYMLGCLS